ncbi:hypothetical protein Ruko_03760 [Ruthenibacterium sp. TH_2024_36131]
MKFPKRHYIFHSGKCKKGARKKQKYIIRDKIEEKKEETGIESGKARSTPFRSPLTPPEQFQ